MRTHEDGHGWDAMTSDASGDTPDSGGLFFRHRRWGTVAGGGPSASDGGGGMGQVWEAVQISPRRSGALKLMPSGRSWTGLHPVELVSWNDCVRTLGLVVSTAPRRAEPGPRGQNAW